MKNLFMTCIMIVVAGFSLLLLGCSDTNGSAPSSQIVKGHLALELPSYMEMTSFKVVTFENFGDKIDPDIRARFRAEAKIIEPLYMETARVDGKSVLAKTLSIGYTIRISGKYQAQLRGERWIISLQDIAVTPNIVDEPLSEWDAGRYVFEGSEEETTLRATAETKRSKQIEKNNKRKKLEEERRVAAYKAQQVRKRIEAEEQEKTAKLQSKLGKEKSARELADRNKQEAERRAQIQAAADREKQRKAETEATRVAFRSAVAGTWEAVTPVFDRYGDVYKSKIAGWCKINSAIKFRLVVPAGEYDTSIGTLTIYNDPTPEISGTTETTIMTDAIRQSIKITFPETPLNCTYSNGQGNIFSNGGAPWTGIVKNGEVLLTGPRKRTITIRKISS